MLPLFIISNALNYNSVILSLASLNRVVLVRVVLTIVVSTRVVLARVVLTIVVPTRVVLARVILARVMPTRVTLARVVLARVMPTRVTLARVVLTRVVLAKVVLTRGVINSLEAFIRMATDLECRLEQNRLSLPYRQSRSRKFWKWSQYYFKETFPASFYLFSSFQYL